jgi:hypothetical protein
MPLSQADRVERFKIGIDYLKHVTTLSTGSILLIATLLEKLFAKPLWRPLVVVSLIGFMSCVLCSTVSYTLSMATSFPGEYDGIDSSKSDVLGGIFVVLVWASFAVGIVSLGLFAIRNFLQ